MRKSRITSLAGGLGLWAITFVLDRWIVTLPQWVSVLVLGTGGALIMFALVSWVRDVEGSNDRAVMQSGSNNVQVVADRDAIVQQGDGNVVVQAGGTYLQGVPARRESGGRIFVKTTPKAFEKVYEDHLSYQAEQLLKPFRGKWMEIRGRVSDVHDSGDRTIVFVQDEEKSRFAAHFSKKYELEKVKVLSRGEPLVVIGRIKSTGPIMLELEDCELGES